jgi:hypothetical protein
MQSEWQLIETAPKNGTRPSCSGHRSRALDYDKIDRWQRVDETTQKLVEVRDYSSFHGSTVDGICMWMPSRWMPLPEPPTARETRRQG